MNPIKWIYGAPLRAAIILFSVSFGAIMAIRVFIEHKLYTTKWYSFRIGDSILFPIYGFLVALALRDVDKDTKYPGPAWHGFLLAFGVCMGNFILKNNLLFHPFISASDSYHTYSYYLMFVILGSPIPLLIKSRAKGKVIAALLMLLGFVGLVTYDITLNHEPDIM